MSVSSRCHVPDISFLCRASGASNGACCGRRILAVEGRNSSSRGTEEDGGSSGAECICTGGPLVLLMADQQLHRVPVNPTPCPGSCQLQDDGRSVRLNIVLRGRPSPASGVLRLQFVSRHAPTFPLAHLQR